MPEVTLTYAEVQRRRRARLTPFLEQLQCPNESVLLDLCELVLMEAEKMDGGFKWDHPRCVVFIRTRARTRKVTTRKAETRSRHVADGSGPPPLGERR